MYLSISIPGRAVGNLEGPFVRIYKNKTLSANMSTARTPDKPKMFDIHLELKATDRLGCDVKAQGLVNRKPVICTPKYPKESLQVG